MANRLKIDHNYIDIISYKGLGEFIGIGDPGLISGQVFTYHMIVLAFLLGGLDGRDSSMTAARLNIQVVHTSTN